MQIWRNLPESTEKLETWKPVNIMEHVRHAIKKPFRSIAGFHSISATVNPLDCRMIQNGDRLVYMLYMFGFV